MKEWYSRVVRGGSQYIYDVEAFALCHMVQALDGVDRANCIGQLSRLNLVQRSPTGHIVALYQAADRYFKNWGEILLENRQENYLFYEIEISGGFVPKRKLILEIYFHQGRISSIEYRSGIIWPNDQPTKRLDKIEWRNKPMLDVVVVKSELYGQV